ncbi:MAG TPA: SIMPL domain-containing protein [Gammaproteobacteria bacterium]|nr:SIMPL domain-containing protein [Gammaproteobacteria bacterium]
MEGLKKILGVLLSVLIVVLTLNQIKAYQGPAQHLNVTATGKISAVPDTATATLGVVTEGATPLDVKTNNTEKMNAVIAYLKQMNIPDKDIQTNRFNTSPRYQYQSGKNTIIGYQSDQTVTVIFRHIDTSPKQLEETLDGVIQQGANTIQSVNFSFSNDDALKQAATKQAIEKAKKNAAILTDEAGLNLGKLINIIPSTDEMPIQPMAYHSTAKMATNAINTIEPGSQDVSAGVTLVYEVN